jgi:hypothetical protein
MLIEIAGFVLGMLTVGAALFVFYRRQTDRALDNVYASTGPRQRI